MRISLSMSVALLLLAGCAGSQQLQVDSSGASSSLAGKTLAVRTGKVGKLVVRTPGKVLLAQGMLGGLLVDSASEDIAKKYGVPDPAKRVAEGLAKKLEARHGVARAVDGQNADLMLEVETTFWDINYGPVQ